MACSLPASPASTSFADELTTAIEAARDASIAIIKLYTDQSARLYEKGDGSPVTDADLAADAIIQEVIGGCFPNDTVMTEEGAKDDTRLTASRVWIVDPIDGTAQFIKRTGKFDIMIALTIDGRPVVAVTAQPTTGLIHAAVVGEGAWRIDHETVQEFTIGWAPPPPRLVSSKWHHGSKGWETLRSVAECFKTAAPVVLDVGFQPRAFDSTQRNYDAFLGLWHPHGESPVQEWDVAASDLIIHEAGGCVTDLWGRRFAYNNRDTTLVGGLVISASPGLHRALITALEPYVGEGAPLPSQ